MWLAEPLSEWNITRRHRGQNGAETQHFTVFQILDYLVDYCRMIQCSSWAPEILWGE